MRPTLRAVLPWVAAVVVASVTAALGFWQLDRAAQKTALQAAWQVRQAEPALTLESLASDAAAAQRQLHRRALVEGRWLAAATVYLDNRPMDGRVGFYAVTPLLLDDGTAVAVQRGWLPRDQVDRTRIVAAPPPDGRVRVGGRLALTASRLYEFEPSTAGTIRQNLDVDRFAAEKGLKLRPLVLVQEGEATRLDSTAAVAERGDGLRRDWPAPATGVARNHGYALQWFGLSALTLALVLWLQVLRPRRSGAAPAALPSAPRSDPARPLPSELADRPSTPTVNAPEPIVLTVHRVETPQLDDAAAAAQRRTRSGRLRMLLILAVCAAPVVASYVAYFIVQPRGQAMQGTLIVPTRTLPAALPLASLDGRPVAAASLRGQWLLVVVGAAGCDAACEKHLLVQRQLREMLGRERDRVDKVWLVTDDAPLRPALAQAIGAGVPVQVLRVPNGALAQWLQPGPGRGLADHLYVVDPMGEWMMRMPFDAEPSRLKRDLERLLRASSFWDRPGR